MSWIRKIFQKKQVDLVNNDTDLSTTSKIRESPTRVSTDNPIYKQEDDTLGRTRPAASFSKQILTLDASEGVVVGVLGAWGSGKTSFVNLTKGFLKESDIVVIEFNPWMFSGADQLVQSFFIELSAQLKLRSDTSEIGELVEDYGEIFSGLSWLPIVGPWIERGKVLTDILAKTLQRKKEGIGAIQAKVREGLKKLDKPIVVILDDIDRLSTPEIRDVFKLVRLTANFPNIVYVVAFDRYRVEQALGEQGISGRDYLEKILQIGIDLPAIPEHLLNSQIFKVIDTTIEGIKNPGHFDSDRWPDVFMEIIQPLIKNMRDVRRYAAAIHGTVQDLDGQVALVDVLALEAIRVFLPDVFQQLHVSIEGLTTTANFSLHEEPAQLREQIECLVTTDEEVSKIVSDLVRRLFPCGERHLEGGMHYDGEWSNRWLRERLVAHKDILRFYLERVAGDQLLAFSEAEIAWSKIADKDEFESYLKSLPEERLQDVISSLEAYEEEFGPEHVVNATVVLLNLLPNIPERQKGMFGFGTTTTVTRVVYRFIRALQSSTAVETAVQEIFPQVESLYSKHELTTIVGHREGAGHKLVSENLAKTIEKERRDEIRAATPEELANETSLLRIFLFIQKTSEPDEPELIIPNSSLVTHALLKSARSEVRSQSWDSRAVQRYPRLAWDILVSLYGDEDILRARIEDLKASTAEEASDLLELTDKYLSGWRPNEFNDN